MTALHATGCPDLTPVVLRARTDAAGAQYLGDDEYRGGFGYDSSTQRAYTDLLNTFYAAQAMRTTADAEEAAPPANPAPISTGMKLSASPTHAKQTRVRPR